MITVDEALALILARAQPLPPRRHGLSEAQGLMLTDDVTSEWDSPPYDKSIVDGYAIVAADLQAGAVELTVLEEIVAGAVPHQAVRSGYATRIMTGAPVPLGADAVVMVERTEIVRAATGGDLGAVRICDQELRAGRNILRRGTAMRAGDVALPRGARVGAAAIGLLAEIGRAHVDVIPRPTIAILPTGNELVDVDVTPGPGQIRNSNGPLLAAAARMAGALPNVLDVARDEHGDLRAKISAGLACDALVLSGGVSAGVLDLVPQVLSELGVTEVFHKVRLKPGKPLWFGVAANGTLVFGLPGNPVSSFVCFELFVRPALLRLMGRMDPVAPRVTANLATEFRHRGERPTYLPAVLRCPAGAEASVAPVDWRGSADLRSLAQANALIAFDSGDRDYAPGTSVEVLPLADV